MLIAVAVVTAAGSAGEKAAQLSAVLAPEASADQSVVAVPVVVANHKLSLGLPFCVTMPLEKVGVAGSGEVGVPQACRVQLMPLLVPTKTPWTPWQTRKAMPGDRLEL